MFRETRREITGRSSSFHLEPYSGDHLLIFFQGGNELILLLFDGFGIRPKPLQLRREGNGGRGGILVHGLVGGSVRVTGRLGRSAFVVVVIVVFIVVVVFIVAVVVIIVVGDGQVDFEGDFIEEDLVVGDAFLQALLLQQPLDEAHRRLEIRLLLLLLL